MILKDSRIILLNSHMRLSVPTMAHQGQASPKKDSDKKTVETKKIFFGQRRRKSWLQGSQTQKATTRALSIFFILREKLRSLDLWL